MSRENESASSGADNILVVIIRAERNAAIMKLIFSLVVLWSQGGLGMALAADDRDEWARMRAIEPRGYVCGHISGPIVVDGKLDERYWQQAAPTEEFIDIEGASQPPPRFKTRAKMLWDDRYFYIGAQLEEPHVWGTLTNHDAVIFQDPDFEIFIDPDGDSHDYYEFEMNALNTGWDLLLTKPYKDGGKARNEWEIPGLKTAVHVDGTLNQSSDRDRGWSVEIAIPWKALAGLAHRPAPPQEGDQWRVNFSRVEWQIELIDGHYRKLPGKREDNWVWSPQGIIDMHRPEKWGYVQFTRSQADASQFRRDPSASARTLLHGIYYAQRNYQKQHSRWARSLDELALPPEVLKNDSVASVPTMSATPEGFEASVAVKDSGQSTQTWCIRQDARVWRR
jgi:hypothetical protein